MLGVGIKNFRLGQQFEGGPKLQTAAVMRVKFLYSVASGKEEMRNKLDIN